MPLTNHALINELPEYRDLIHQLKISDDHFAKLFAQYDNVEHEVHRIEAGAEAASDERLESLKKTRLRLKDDLFNMLQKAG